MRIFREWIRRLHGTLFQGRRDAELEHEIRSHMEMAEEDARVVVSTSPMPRAPRGLRREAFRKPWRRFGTSEACRGWMTLRAT
jgi:hypothetical protein